jgi:hypothetical protein
MTKNNIDLGLGIIKNTILDNLEKSFRKLDLSDDVLGANQCQRFMKNGQRCHVIKTNNITKSCWGHMTSTEKEEHRMSKNKPSGKKYSLQRKLEDEADE